MDSGSPANLPCASRISYSRGERSVIWICIFLPGIASALIYFAYVEWAQPWIPMSHFWEGILFWGLIALVTLAICGFTGYLKACKSGCTNFARRTTKLAFHFLLGQVLIAPLVFLILLFVIYRFF